MNGTIPPGEYAVVTQEGPWEAAALWDFDPAYVSSGVKTGKSRSEQLFSDLPPEADLTADIPKPTLSANRDLTPRSKNIGICALMISRV